jgi:hypothetical protein
MFFWLAETGVTSQASVLTIPADRPDVIARRFDLGHRIRLRLCYVCANGAMAFQEASGADAASRIDHVGRSSIYRSRSDDT